MKKLILLTFAFACIFFQHTISQTSWTGSVNTNWSIGGNWTAGVPTATVNAILGDANFTGGNQPTVNSVISCASLTIGGTVATTLTIGKNVTVSGNITLYNNGSIIQNKSTIFLAGNWINDGSYTASNNTSIVTFNGIIQQIAGTNATTFRRLNIDEGSAVTLGRNLIINGTGSQFSVDGILNPSESPTYQVTSPNLTLGSTGTLKVNASTFAGNYNISGNSTLSAGSIVEYASISVNQVISNSLTYSTLKISGTTMKTLAGNLPALNSIAGTEGNIYVTSGIFDLGTFTANRGTTTVGGTISVSNNANLKIGGTGSFPANFTTNDLGISSTVEYCGSNQSVSIKTYGNLSITTTGSKTAMGALTIQNNFTLTSGTFIGGNFVHTVGGNWLMTGGTFTNSSTTIRFNGVSNQYIQSTGAFNNLTVNNSSGYLILQSDITIEGLLGFSRGKVKTAGNTLMLTSTGSITGAGLSTGWVWGKLQRNIATGSGIIRDFSIGDSLAYTPVALNFGSVITAGNFTCYTSKGNHPYCSESQISNTKKLNIYFCIRNSGVVFTNYSSVFNFNEGSQMNNADPSVFMAGLHNGSSWNYPTAGIKTTASTQILNLNEAGDFILGENGCNVMIPSVTGTSRCGPGIVTLMATPATGETIDWYAGAIGGTALSTSTNNFTTPTLSVTTNFYALARNILTGCVSERAMSTAAVRYLPATPVLNGPSRVCDYMGAGNSAIYSIRPVPEADLYIWKVPFETSIVGHGSTSNSPVSSLTTSDTNILVNFTLAYKSGIISVKTSNICGNSADISIKPTRSLLPPETIYGPLNICAYIGLDSAAVYSVPKVQGVIKYFWTVPNGVKIVGHGMVSVSPCDTLLSVDTSISVVFSHDFRDGSQISVQSVAGCGYGGARLTRYINTKAPGIPLNTMIGPTNACLFIGTNTLATYALKPVPTATSYKWTVPNGAAIVGHGTTSHSPVQTLETSDTLISVAYSSSFVSGKKISVQAFSNCGMSNIMTKTISRIKPSLPRAIMGSVNVCNYSGSDNIAYYRVNKVLNAATYLWTAPAGSQIVYSGNHIVSPITSLSTTDTIIGLRFDSVFTTGSLKVASQTTCNISSARSLTIKAIKPTVPGLISGPINICANISNGVPAIYGITAVQNAATYDWIVPTGATILSGQGTTSITVSFTSAFTSGNISVASLGTCGNSAYKNLGIVKAPPKPGVISATGLSCPSNNVTYFIAPVPGTTNYVWSLPSKAIIVSGQGTTQLEVNFLSTFTSGSITVRAQNECAIGLASSLSLSDIGCTQARTITETPISDETGINEIQIYPNPATTNFHLFIPDPNKIGKATIEIFDLTGRSFNVYQAKGDAGKINADFTNMNLPAGTYRVQVKIGNERRSTLLIIEN